MEGGGWLYVAGNYYQIYCYIIVHHRSAVISLYTWFVIICKIDTVGSVQDDPLGGDESYGVLSHSNSCHLHL